MTASIADSELTLVKKTALFGGLRDDVLNSMLAATNVLQVEPGKMIFMQGDPVNACYIVLEGWVKIYRLTPYGDEAVVHVFARGQSFAEAAVFSMEDYPVSAEAVTKSKLLQIPYSTVKRFVQEDPEFAMSMLGSASKHLHQLVIQIEQLKTQSGAQRVARFLLSLCPVQSGSCIIGLPYDKALIASRLGMKPESLSRAFARLRNIGVCIQQNAAEIGSIEQLKTYAHVDNKSSNEMIGHE